MMPNPLGFVVCLFGLCVLLAFAGQGATAAQPAACALAPRLVLDQRGRVIGDSPVNLRHQPSTREARLGYVTPGAHFTVLDGPICADTFQWWQVAFAAVDVVSEAGNISDAVLIGWIAEGSPLDGEYWLEPRGELILVENEDGAEIAYIRDAEGNLEREGCMRPPDDVTRIQLGYATLNARTLAMLDNAQRIYRAGGGFVDFRQAITQGGYNAGGVTASFGTHDGGGAVDLSVRSYVDFSILTGEIAPMLDALRVAGFAAWLRDTGELYANSPIHIHAIAIGDPDLSAAARDQIDGPYGYLRGYNGLPPEWGGPALDIYGMPVICRWMVAMGFDDLREQPEATPEPTARARR